MERRNGGPVMLDVKDVRNQILKHSTKRFGARNVNSITEIAIHHSATSAGNSASFARTHVNTHNWAGIGYHYVVLKNGTIEYCGDINTSRANVGNNNSYVVGICLVGDYTRETPPQAQMESALKLVEWLRLNFPNIKRVRGHKEFPGHNTNECPGIDMDGFRKKYEDFIKRGSAPVSNVPKWKIDNLEYLHKNEMVSDFDGWLKKIDDNMPAWAVFSILANMHKVLKGESEKK